ncbi:hypothetical protein P3G55_25950 [Leptospira sp. 96542]|nr:hypothetical protein [Leptospira sp. 96542]
MTPITWTTLTLLALGVELDVPDGWFCKPLDARTVIVYESEQDPYAATFEIQLAEPDTADPNWFENFVAGVPSELARVEGYQPLGSSRFQLASLGGVPVYAITGRRPEPGDGAVTTRMLAWAWVSPQRVQAFSGASVVRDEARNLAIFDRVLRSLRLFEPRTD